ncbi:ATP-binding protein [Arthrobacter sp. 24S4-2]|uniref:protein DpdH n=1 Tax=Arthrobacter sp. 24S4-2 TaxID=2575374 RepID=UPI0010C7B674|nr:protein DpdH [Arthrobacter sp. 24S4-2]QCO97300.1 ATP-binding protein [Arthrobacter sp. 24S4-2]
MNQVVCWRPEDVANTIPTEAASPSKPVLLATHTPLRIRKAGLGELGESISEEEFLDEFLNSTPKEGIRVTPVLGQSGSGKSHLVRWAEARIQPIPGRRRIIYLPKTRTSLRDVIEELVQKETGEEFDEIRSQLGGLRESVDPEKLGRRLLDELAESIREAAADNFLSKVLVGERGLYVLLHDPMFREYLLRPGAFVPSRAAHALRGRGDNEEDVPTEFTVDDLPLSIADHGNIRDAGSAARLMFKRLSADTKLQSAAIDMLNEHLDVAVMRAADLGVGTVQRAFMTLREKLVGQEIILLVEDFAIIQGIKRDLLDAIIEVGTVAGVEKYATVRTMMAVTSGYYDKLDDTFRTRAEASSPVYYVDVRIDDAEDDGTQLVGFVGRYLNAARLGKAKIEASAVSVNACEGCQFRDECHATFGATKDGFGLYPYNEPALRRAIKITADPMRRDLFNPRTVLSKMVRPVLANEASAIREGRFPSPEFLRHDRARDRSESPANRLPDLPLSLRRALDERYEGPEQTRYLVVFQFWGDVSQNVNPGIYAAFSLPSADLEADDAVEPKPAPIPTTPGESVSPISATVRRQLEDVDNWSKGSPLPQAVAREIRSIVRQAMVAGLDWSEPIMKDPSAPILAKAVPDKAQISRTVSIEDSREGRAAVVEPIVRFARTPGNALLFQTLLQFQDNPASAPEGLLRLRELADRHRGELTGRVIAASDFSDDKLVAAAASLISGAALCGQLPTKPKASDYVAAALWGGQNYSRGDTTLTDLWTKAEGAYLATRKMAVEGFRAAIGSSQGATGAVHAIDDPRARKIVEAARKLTAPPEPDEMPDWALVAEKARRNFEASVHVQIADWRRVVAEVRNHIPDDVSYSATVDAIIAATQAGQSQGYVKERLADVQRANAHAKTLNFSSVARLESALVEADGKSGLALALTIGGIDARDAASIREYLRFSAVWLDAGLTAAESQQRDGALDVDEDIDAVLRKWARILEAEEGEKGVR